VGLSLALLLAGEFAGDFGQGDGAEGVVGVGIGVMVVMV
jgi:hypothetical protein